MEDQKEKNWIGKTWGERERERRNKNNKLY